MFCHTEANQSQSERASGVQADSSDGTAPTGDSGLGQRQQGDGQSTTNLAGAGRAGVVGGASQQTPPVTGTTSNGDQTTGTSPASSDSTQQMAPGVSSGLVPPFSAPPPPPFFMGPPSVLPPMPPFGFMGMPPPMGGELCSYDTNIGILGFK